MTKDVVLNPAEKAGQEALEQVFKCIDESSSFILEAGAGAGKTYSLIKALQHLIDNEGKNLLRRHQQVACITYTNVAKDEIIARTDGHPVVYCETIHAFCWSLIKDFQPNLRKELPSLGKWAERIEEQGIIGERPIVYELGYPAIEETQVTLHHDDVVGLTIALLKNEKFQRLFIERYPILFIDEYQDTDARFAEALQTHFLGKVKAPLIGLFGDPWQKVYGSGCGGIKHDSLKPIGKQSNFRSVSAVVNVLNKMRPDLEQFVSDPEAHGTATVYHSNNWGGERKAGAHWKGDLPDEVAKAYLDKIKQNLAEDGWDLAPERTKILMLTHNVLAEEQDYKTLLGIFSNNDDLIKLEDEHIKFFIELLEPVCTAYIEKRYGEMFSVLGRKTPGIRSHKEKLLWAKDMDQLKELRASATIGEVLDLLKKTKRPRLTEAVERWERILETAGFELAIEEALANDQGKKLLERKQKKFERKQKLRAILYKEVINFSNFYNETSPYKTKHGVKGAEYENVLVVMGRGWNHYNDDQMLDWVATGIPEGKQDTFERSRNLFYVACSRPKTRLALLFTQELSHNALSTLKRWFGEDAVLPLEV